ncbi:hypothetical protein KAR91_57985 [Candidatus Pacearchaeota archaeon]|nr:hypothetical protein [Candidatus Pacearchaeota archaeon]
MGKKRFKCPCYRCLTFAICKNKDPLSLIINCSLLHKYIIIKENRANIQHVEEFCGIMGKTLKKIGRRYIIEYP